jgi:hypothetical protein
MTSPGLSVVLPTLNCADALPAHLASMRSWLDLADEVIAVDSHSEDGTPEMIRERLKHPNLRVLDHPRGLYQSWNSGIRQTTGRWIYISTIGDTIKRAQLEHMLAAGESLGSDVVASPPAFVFDDHITIDPPVWPIRHILDFHGIDKPTELSPAAAFVHAVRHIPSSILGSSASDIYRGDHLRARPFPLDYGVAGDTGWAIQHGLDTRFCFTNRVGSVFRFHSDIYTRPEDGWVKRSIHSLRNLGMRVLKENLESGKSAEILGLLEDFEKSAETLRDAQKQWGVSRRSSAIGIPWYLRPAAVHARCRRNDCRREHHGMAQRLEEALKTLPVKSLD